MESEQNHDDDRTVAADVHDQALPHVREQDEKLGGAWERGYNN